MSRFQTIPKLLAAVILLVMTRLAVSQIDSGTAPKAAEMPQIAIETIPATLGSWTGMEEPLDSKLTRGSGANDMINRTYRNPLRKPVLLNCGVWTTYDTVLPHSPEACYPAAGWELIDKEDVPITSSKGATATARLLTYQRDADRIAILFFCHLNDEVIVDHEPIRLLKQRLRGKETSLPAAVKVTLQTELDRRSSAKQRLEEFAQLLLDRTIAISKSSGT